MSLGVTPTNAYLNEKCVMVLTIAVEEKMRVIVQIMEHVLIVNLDVAVMGSVYLSRNTVMVFIIVLTEVMKNANLGRLFSSAFS